MIEVLSHYWPLLVTAFFVSAVVSRLLAFIAVKRGKSAPTRTGGSMPLTGGIGVFLGFFLGLIVFFIKSNLRGLDGLGFLLFFFIWFIAAVFPYFILGILDDVFHFKPFQKLSLHFIVIFIQFFLFNLFETEFSCCGVKEIVVQNLLLVTALFFFSNSYNFLDNADGHCASAVLGLTFALLFVLKKPDECSCVPLLLSFAVLGFLVWNFPAKPVLYLGDAGSLFLGACAPALIFLFVIWPMQGDKIANIIPGIFTAVILLAFPLYDTCAVMLLRVLRGQNPTIGGQDHYSHRLMRGGFPLWLVNLIAFTAAGILPVLFIKLPEGAIYFGPFIIWAFLLFLDVLAAFLCWKKSGNH